MGGHASKTTATDTASSVISTVQSATASSFTYSSANNTFNLSGSGNVIDVVDQTVTMTITSQTAVNSLESAQTGSDIAAAVENTVSDKGVSFTQWLDDSSDTAKSEVTTTSSEITSQIAATTCFETLSGSNLFVVSGSGNVVKDAIQSATIDSLSSCILKSDDVSASVNAMTNAINQSSTYTSENPFAFIADAAEAAVRDALVLGAIVFVLVVAFVATAKALARRGAAEDDGSPAPAPSAATAS